MRIPSLILRQLYTFGSLENLDHGIRFGIKNCLSDVKLTAVRRIRIDGKEIPVERLALVSPDGQVLPADRLSVRNPLSFALRKSLFVTADGIQLEHGKHKIDFSFEAEGYGKLKFSVEDSIAEEGFKRVSVPYEKEDNLTSEIIAKRQRFVEEFSGVRISHLNRYSLDPATTEGNIENFTGVAQVPIGFAGPMTVNGEHAQGDYLIPLATSEGTLVASYNRGIKLLNLSGGVTCTVAADYMQRAPVFIFDSARQARDFKYWVDENIASIRDAAEATSRIAKLIYVDAFLSNKFLFLRFNYTTGDAAGQNMVGRATFAACSWILENNDTIRKFYLESNLATDKKSSQVNVMRTRGKRVVAEATVPRKVLIENMRVEPENLLYHSAVANVGAFLSGANNNGAHSPNAITAMFIATGQDVANVAESSAGIMYTEQTPEGDLYVSLTIPSLIVATHGGGTSLATQRECLEIMQCYGKGKVLRLAEIIGGVALAGELSLASAISSLDWVSSHERYGRNR